MKCPICEMELHKVEGKFPGWVCDKCEMLWKVELLCQDDNCKVCGKPFSEHKTCPKCGYTDCDKMIHGDHYLCDKSNRIAQGE